MKFILAVVFCFSFLYSKAQVKLFTKNGIISFYSKSLLENIEAKNKTALAIWDAENGNIEFAVLIRGFQFDKALMQEHFNENFMESDKYPKAFFKGQIENSKNISLTTDNTSIQKIKGVLTIHGVSKPIEITATILIKNGVISANSIFTIALADYNIKIPAINLNNISKQIQVTVNVPAFKKMK